jgi:hypothetical protein
MAQPFLRRGSLASQAIPRTMKAKASPARTDTAERELTRMIERRADAGKGETDVDEADEMWRESVRREQERERRQNRAAWYAHEMNLCEAHERLAQEHERAALELLEEPQGADNGRRTAKL